MSILIIVTFLIPEQIILVADIEVHRFWKNGENRKLNEQVKQVRASKEPGLYPCFSFCGTPGLPPGKLFSDHALLHHKVDREHYIEDSN